MGDGHKADANILCTHMHTLIHVYAGAHPKTSHRRAAAEATMQRTVTSKKDTQKGPAAVGVVVAPAALLMTRSSACLSVSRREPDTLS